MKIPAIAVRFDKINIKAVEAIKRNGGYILPVEGQIGRYWFVPPLSCRWSYKQYQHATLRLPDNTVITCIPKNETVELVMS